jgi:redox-sensing transcriptional repressor
MAEPARAPEASLLRLSRYHCFVGGLIRSGDAGRVTSREMAEQLGVAEETIRRDLAYVGAEGRPGAGYDPSTLYDALESYLGLSDSYPFVAVGSAAMLGSLDVIFPAEEFGLRPAGYFSERDEDAGAQIHGLTVRPLDDIRSIDPAAGISVALVACEPGSVQRTLGLLDAAGIRAVLMLTPTLRPQHPAGMEVTYFRIPCAMKALAATAPKPKQCCSKGACGC